MTIHSSRDLFAWAHDKQTSLVAFNVITIEQVEAIAWSAEESGTPVIAQLSENAIDYHRAPGAIAAAMARVAESSSAPVALHLDHITRRDLAMSCVDLGFSSLMWDSSTIGYTENVEQTRNICEWAHENQLWVESELGEIGGKDGAHAPGVRTDPAEAARFVADTGVDALAVAVGSSHAMTDRSAQLDLNLIERISQACSVPLVLHGSSGVPDADLVAASRAGMRKINIGTALSIAFTGALRQHLESHQDTVDPRKYLQAAREATVKEVSHFLRLISKPF